MDAKMVGQKIKEARLKANLTQEELGNLIGMPKANVSRLEHGIHGKWLDTLNKIAKSLNCDLSIEFKPKK